MTPSGSSTFGRLCRMSFTPLCLDKAYADWQPAQSQDSRACTNDQAQVFPMMPLPLTVLFGQQECGGSAGGHG